MKKEKELWPPPDFRVELPSFYEDKYFGRFVSFKEERVECRCGWRGFRGELTHEVDIEMMHPRNRNNPRCTLMDQSDCHKTAFEKCPKCTRVRFADGKPL